MPRFAPAARRANRALIEALTGTAARRRATPAQLAPAWLLAQQPWIVPIPGTIKLQRLAENTAAVSVVLLPDDLQEIGTALAASPVQVARYSANRPKLVGN